MLHPQLPADLKEFVRKSILKKIFVFACALVAYTLLLFFFGKIIFHTESPLFVLAFWLIGAGILAAILHIPAMLTDKTVYGTVAKTLVKTEDCKELTAGLGSLKQNHIVDLIITSPDGKTYYKHISAVEDKAAARASTDRYKAGDTVFHLRTTPHTVLLPKGNDSSVQCAVCGRANDKSRDTCESCAHTLIKSVCFEEDQKEKE